MEKMKDDLKQRFIDDGFDCYLFYIPVKSEIAICEKLNRRYPKAYFLALRRMMHRSKDGKKWNEEDILLRNYAFAYVEKGASIDFLQEVGSLLYLEDAESEGKLSNQNYEYSKWVLENDGLLGLSTAVLENGLTKITGGPLLKMKDHIKKYDRRNRNCFISIDVADVKIETWMPFEWEDGI